MSQKRNIRIRHITVFVQVHSFFKFLYSARTWPGKMAFQGFQCICCLWARRPRDEVVVVQLIQSGTDGCSVKLVGMITGRWARAKTVLQTKKKKSFNPLLEKASQLGKASIQKHCTQTRNRQLSYGVWH